MSASKWAYEPEICDGDYCCGDCDHCSTDKVEKVLDFREAKAVPRDFYERVVSSLSHDVVSLQARLDLLEKPRGVYECFHCGSYAVIWDNDFSLEDYGYEGDGIVHACHCANCGAEIEYRIYNEEGDNAEIYNTAEADHKKE